MPACKWKEVETGLFENPHTGKKVTEYELGKQGVKYCPQCFDVIKLEFIKPPYKLEIDFSDLENVINRLLEDKLKKEVKEETCEWIESEDEGFYIPQCEKFLNQDLITLDEDIAGADFCKWCGKKIRVKE